MSDPSFKRGRPLELTRKERRDGVRVRPRDCEDGPRPCPWHDCRYYLEHGILTGFTCAVDVADEGPQSSKRVAELLGVSRQRVEYIEKRAKDKLRKRGLPGR